MRLFRRRIPTAPKAATSAAASRALCEALKARGRSSFNAYISALPYYTAASDFTRVHCGQLNALYSNTSSNLSPARRFRESGDFSRL